MPDWSLGSFENNKTNNNMNIVIRNVLLGGLLWLAVPLSAQVSQDLIDKAKAAGMTDDQIRQEINKRMGQSGTEQTTRTA